MTKNIEQQAVVYSVENAASNYAWEWSMCLEQAFQAGRYWFLTMNNMHMSDNQDLIMNTVYPKTPMNINVIIRLRSLIYSYTNVHDFHSKANQPLGLNVYA